MTCSSNSKHQPKFITASTLLLGTNFSSFCVIVTKYLTKATQGREGYFDLQFEVVQFNTVEKAWCGCMSWMAMSHAHAQLNSPSFPTYLVWGPTHSEWILYPYLILHGNGFRCGQNCVS